MTQAWASAIAATGNESGWSAISPPAAATKGTVWATVVAVHTRPDRRSRRSSTSPRQWTPASSGRASRGASKPAPPPPPESTAAATATATDGPPGPAGTSGAPEGPGGPPLLATRDRQPQDHEVGVERQLADLLGVALPGRDHAEV